MAEKILNLMKTINPQIQETQWTLNKRNMKQTTPQHNIIKLLKTSDKNEVLQGLDPNDFMGSVEI